jgi:hypothetical protein
MTGLSPIGPIAAAGIANRRALGGSGKTEDNRPSDLHDHQATFKTLAFKPRSATVLIDGILP